MKRLICSLLVINTTFAYAENNAMDFLLDKISTTNDFRISKDINGYYLLEGVNPDDMSKCQISVKKYNSSGEVKIGYSIGVVDLNPDSERVNNPVVGIDIKRFRANSTGGESKVVDSGEEFIEIRSSSTIPFWLGQRSGAELEFDGDLVEVKSYWSGGPFSRSGKYYKMKTEEDVREFFSSGAYNNLGYLRPSDKIRCDFEFSAK